MEFVKVITLPLELQSETFKENLVMIGNLDPFDESIPLKMNCFYLLISIHLWRHLSFRIYFRRYFKNTKGVKHRKINCPWMIHLESEAIEISDI
jgi:hypothetical protein